MADQDKSKINRKRKRSGNNVGTPALNTSISVSSQAPRGINVTDFAEARALELHNMVEAISMADKLGSKRIFQSLPKHMRRRAVSHNAKRMPVRLRDAAKKEETAPKETQLKPKKKNRHQRRKTRNLLQEYNRRKKQNIWLETHIWHAKRMKMVNAWGYKLAEHPSDKGFRAGHRALANTCLLQDISYYCCIEIKGYRHLIIAAMSQITRAELGPTIASMEYRNSGKEGHTILYHPQKYPYGAIGLVSFMWKTCILAETSNETKSDNIVVENGQCAQLWIWAHPSCYTEALETIQKVCENVSSTENSSTLTSADAFNNEHEEILTHDSNNGLITVSSLRFDLARLRLTGPLAHPLLVELLELQIKPKSNELPVEVKGEEKINQAALEEDSKDNDLNAEDVWESLKCVPCTSSLPPGITLGLIVLDPRLSLPGKRTSIDKLVTEQNTAGCHLKGTRSKLLHVKWPSRVASSSLWELETRLKVKESKMDDQQLNNLRSNLLVPSTRLDLGDKASHIPILLVQQPGKKGYGAGWDIILPSGWTMAFWIALVYRGARVGGLRESRNCSLECEVPYFPRDAPDTRTCKQYIEETGKECENNYARYPPNKRPNYHKLGIPSPFKSPWKQLVQEWKSKALNQEHLKLESSDPAEERYDSATSGIRSDCSASGANDKIDDDTLQKNKCDSISTMENNVKKNCLESKPSDCESYYILRDFAKLRDIRDMFTLQVHTKRQTLSVEETLDLNPLNEIMQHNLHALVAVSLRMVNQGYPLPNATVSIPNRSDLELLQRSHKYGGPVEPLHKGPKQDLSTVVFDSTSLIGCCTREVIGFVTSGQYSLSRGCGVGIAYCALPGLFQLLSLGKKGIVLTRNTTTQQYRFAFLTVL